MAIDKIVQSTERMEICEPGQLQISSLADNPLGESYLMERVGAPRYLQNVDSDSQKPQPAYQPDNGAYQA